MSANDPPGHHVLIDISAAAPRPTGIGVYVHETIRRLVAIDGRHRVTLLHYSLRQPPPEWAIMAATTWPQRIYLVHRSVPGPFLLELWRRFQGPTLARLARSSPFGRPDVTFSPATFLPPGSPGSHSVCTVHDLTFLDHPAPSLFADAKGWIRHRTGPGYLAHAVRDRIASQSHILCISHAGGRELRRRWPEIASKFDGMDAMPPITVTPLGVSEEFRRATQTPATRPYWFFPGGDHPRKGLENLLAAYERQIANAETGNSTAASRETMPMLLLGGSFSGRSTGPSPLAPPLAGLPPLRALPPALATSHPRAALNTALLPYVDRPTLAQIYSAAIALVYPSVEEGFGLPVVEALACGCPVITTTATAVVEHLPPDSVFTVPPGNSEALFQAMERLLNSTEVAATMRADGPHLAADFSWEKTAAATLAVLLGFGAES